MIHGNNAIPAELIVDATTVGRAIVTVPNPGAVRYIRINADNTVSTLDAATFLTAIGGGAGGGTFDANQSITDNRTWTITGGKTLTITGGPVLFEGSSLTVETVGNTFGTNQTVISSSEVGGLVNVITIRNADYTAGGAAGINANLLVSDYFTINPDLTTIGFIGDINFDGTAFGLSSIVMTVDVTNGTISGPSGGVINTSLATMTGPWSFADGAGVSDSGAAGASWTFNAGNSGTPANDSLARVTYMHSTADPNWRGLWLSINAIPNDGGSSLKDDSSYPRNNIGIEQSWDTGLGYRQSEFHCTLNDRRVFQFNVKDTDANFATGALTVPTTVGIPAANTSGEPALKVIDARPVSGDAMKTILWNQAATGTSGSVQVVMRGDQIGSDDGTHQNYWSILAGHELNNTRSFSITDNLSGGGTRLYIKANGNIGIGNTAPTSKLDVTGTVTATAFVGTGTITLGELDGDQGEAIFRSGEGGSVTLRTDGITETDHAITMPSVSGTMALTSDISTLSGTVIGWLTDGEIDAHFDLIAGNSILTLGENGGSAGMVTLYGSVGGIVAITSPASASSGTITIDAGTNTFSFENGTAKIIVPSTINGTLGSAALTAASAYDPAGSAAAAVSDTAYDATSWNGVTTVAPSKNAVRNMREAMGSEFVRPSTALFSLPFWQVSNNTATANGSGRGFYVNGVYGMSQGYGNFVPPAFTRFRVMLYIGWTTNPGSDLFPVYVRFNNPYQNSVFIYETLHGTRYGASVYPDDNTGLPGTLTDLGAASGYANSFKFVSNWITIPAGWQSNASANGFYEFIGPWLGNNSGGSLTDNFNNNHGIRGMIEFSQ